MNAITRTITQFTVTVTITAEFQPTRIVKAIRNVGGRSLTVARLNGRLEYETQNIDGLNWSRKAELHAAAVAAGIAEAAKLGAERFVSQCVSAEALIFIADHLRLCTGKVGIQRSSFAEAEAMFEELLAMGSNIEADDSDRALGSWC